MKYALLSFALLSVVLLGAGCGSDDPEESTNEQTNEVNFSPNLDVSEYTDEDEEETPEEDVEEEDDEEKESDSEKKEDKTEKNTEATVNGDTLASNNFELTVPVGVTIAQAAESELNEYFVTACEDKDCFVSADAVGDDYTLYVLTGNEADLKDGEKFTDIYQSTSKDEIAGESVIFGTQANHPGGSGPNHAYYRADEKTGDFVWIEVSYVEGTGLEKAKETLDTITWK